MGKAKPTGLEKMPTGPGVYLFKGKSGAVLYVGKAKNLRSRAGSYFRKSATHSPWKESMLKKVRFVIHEKTDTELEALVLESNLIKKYRPEYNILRKDDKSYAYLKITDEEWPRLVISHEVGSGGDWFGPFISSRELREALRVVRKFFPFRSCSMKKGEVCLFGRLGLCPCNGLIGKKDYHESIKNVRYFFQGRKKFIIKNLRKSANSLKAGLKREKSPEARIFIEERISRALLKINLLEKIFANTRIIGWDEKVEIDLANLAQELNLKELPQRVEGYDVSNFGGQLAAGSMVVFFNGEPRKDEYRKFKIKTVRSSDDIAMLAEVISRRFSEKHLNRNNGKLWPLPNLIVIDGGKGQLNAGIAVLKEKGLDIPIVSLAKRLEEIHIPGRLHPIVLRSNSPALHLLQRIRDEAHRFAVSYHRLLRRKRFIKY